MNQKVKRLSYGLTLGLLVLGAAGTSAKSQADEIAAQRVETALQEEIETVLRR